MEAEGRFFALNVRDKMFLKLLNLQNFRLFKKKKFAFSKKTTVLVGPNAVGKTCVLEAIYLLSTGKSFRASKEEEMIGYGQEMSQVMGQLSNLDLQIILTKGEVQGKRTARKLYKVNGVGKRWRDFSGRLKVILFRPEDINLVSGPPSLRRDFLDEILEQIDWQYRGCSLVYKKGLRQRNKLLQRIREGEAQKSQLTFWNQLLCKNGQLVTRKREELIEFINQQLPDLQVFYDHSAITEARLEQYAQAELALGNTLVGPHRDDIKLKGKSDLAADATALQAGKLKVDRDLDLYGSRGEQRMAVLQLKLAQLEFVKQKTKQRPVLLLDDIFSELDQSHRKKVLQIIDSCQTIITSTELEPEIKKQNPQIEQMEREKTYIDK